MKYSFLILILIIFISSILFARYDEKLRNEEDDIDIEED